MDLAQADVSTSFLIEAEMMKTKISLISEESVGSDLFTFSFEQYLGQNFCGSFKKKKKKALATSCSQAILPVE